MSRSRLAVTLGLIALALACLWLCRAGPSISSGNRPSEAIARTANTRGSGAAETQPFSRPESVELQRPRVPSEQRPTGAVIAHLRGRDGFPLDGARIGLRRSVDASAAFARGTSDASGVATLDLNAAAPGDELEFEATVFDRVYRGTCVVFDAPAVDVALQCNVVLDVPARYRFALRGTNDEPLPGGIVVLYDSAILEFMGRTSYETTERWLAAAERFAQRDGSVVWAVADGLGTCELELECDGTPRFYTAWARGYLAAIAAPVTVASRSGQTSRIDVELIPGKSVSGIVTAPGGEPVAGASVFGSVNAIRFSSTTDADGAFTLEGVPPNAIRGVIGVRAEGFVAYNDDDFALPSSGGVRIELRNGRRFEFVLVDAHSETPIASSAAQIHLVLGLLRGGTARRDAYRDLSVPLVDGRCSFELPVDVGTFLVHADGYRPVQSTTVEEDSLIVSRTLYASPSCVLEVRLQDEHGAPIDVQSSLYCSRRFDLSAERAGERQVENYPCVAISPGVFSVDLSLAPTGADVCLLPQAPGYAESEFDLGALAIDCAKPLVIQLSK